MKSTHTLQNRCKTEFCQKISFPNRNLGMRLLLIDNQQIAKRYQP